MRVDNFDFNLIRALDVLLEECNVTRAAKRLHIGQSATSSALARLREYFDDELLVIATRKLTPLGETLVVPVRDALLRTRAALALKPGFDPATSQRRFTICASDYTVTVLLADVLAHLAHVAPGVGIDLRNPLGKAMELFERGGVDLLVLPEPYLAGSNHPFQPLFEDTQVCLVWNDNPLVGDTLKFREYMNLGHVTVRFGDERSTVAFEEWFLPRLGRQRRIEATVDNFSTLPLLLVGTERIATVHRRLAEHAAKCLPLRVLAAPFDMAPMVEMLVWPRYLNVDPAHSWLRDQVTMIAGRMPQRSVSQPLKSAASRRRT